SVSLLGDATFCRVTGVDDSFLPVLESLSLNFQPNILLLESDSITSKSKLKAFVEQHPRMVALPCYMEEGANWRSTVAKELALEQLQADEGALTLLAESLAGDAMLLKQEVIKLRLYKGDDSQLREEDILACVSGHEQEVADDV